MRQRARAEAALLEAAVGRLSEPLALKIAAQELVDLLPRATTTTDLAALRYRVQELDSDEVIYVVDARQRDATCTPDWTILGFHCPPVSDSNMHVTDKALDQALAEAEQEDAEDEEADPTAGEANGQGEAGGLL